MKEPSLLSPPNNNSNNSNSDNNSTNHHHPANNNQRPLVLCSSLCNETQDAVEGGTDWVGEELQEMHSKDL